VAVLVHHVGVATVALHTERLRQVREARGLTPSAAAKQAGVSRQSLYAYERGAQQPRTDVAEALARVYEVDLSFLTTGPVRADAPVFYRSLASTTKRSRARVERRVEWLLEVCDRLDEFVELPEWRLPRVEARTIEEVAESSFVEGFADELRQEWRLGSDPVGDVVGLLESRGVVFTRLHLAQAKLDAFSLFSKRRGRGFGVLNADKGTAVRARQDALHEAFHLMTHAQMADIPEDFCVDREQRNLIERPAKQFPTALLFPERAFRDQVSSRSSLDDLLRLKPRWGVSVAAMVVRGAALGIFDEAQKTSMFRAISYRGWRKKEPLDDRLVPEEPTLLRSAIEALKDEQPTSLARLVSVIGIPRSDVEDLCGLPEGFLGQVQSPRARIRVRARPKGGA
jgi:Zn-dependent peptidase ImmA (M78 family)/transcriptional regulator with XRE-family HTH domain